MLALLEKTVSIHAVHIASTRLVTDLMEVVSLVVKKHVISVGVLYRYYLKKPHNVYIYQTAKY